jgi:hypothetical protein
VTREKKSQTKNKMNTIDSTTPIVCTFPDQSSFVLEKVAELSPTHARIIYLDEGLVQELWVPHDFIVADAKNHRTAK